MPSKAECSAREDCKNLAKTLGLCDSHYYYIKGIHAKFRQARLSGEMEYPKIQKHIVAPDFCSVDFCKNRKIGARALCKKHYASKWSYAKSRGVLMSECEWSPPLPVDRPSFFDHNETEWLSLNSSNPLGYRAAHAHINGVLTQRAVHRIVMEQKLGRALLRHETVHHINGIRSDNRVENLELWSSWHPAGQRVEEKIQWAKELIAFYENK